MNTVSGWLGIYQSMVTNDQVFDANKAGLDLNNKGAQGGFSSCPTASQIAPRPRAESNSIDFSQSLTQILYSLGNNLNENPREGFAIVSACTVLYPVKSLFGITSNCLSLLINNRR